MIKADPWVGFLHGIWRKKAWLMQLPEGGRLAGKNDL